MSTASLRYGGFILLILGLIGIISQTAPVWSRYTVLALGVIIIVATIPKRDSEDNNI